MQIFQAIIAAANEGEEELADVMTAAGGQDGRRFPQLTYSILSAPPTGLLMRIHKHIRTRNNSTRH